MKSSDDSCDKVTDALFEVDCDDSIEIDGFEIRIVKSVGESPQQYPDFDEDE